MKNEVMSFLAHYQFNLRGLRSRLQEVRFQRVRGQGDHGLAVHDLAAHGQVGHDQGDQVAHGHQSHRSRSG